MSQSQTPLCNCRRVMVGTIKPKQAIVPWKPGILISAIPAACPAYGRRASPGPVGRDRAGVPNASRVSQWNRPRARLVPEIAEPATLPRVYRSEPSHPRSGFLAGARAGASK